MLHCWSSARYTIPLPTGHRFPIEKYALLCDAVLSTGCTTTEGLHEPERVTRDHLLLAHSADYVGRLTNGTLTAWRAVSGTLEAAHHALDTGIAMNLAGGTHHAFRDHGEGFCVFNDVAVTILTLLQLKRIRRACVIDLDVHQGNGTHAIFASDERVFTFSMHGGRNYPFHKVGGSLDLALEDGTGDDEYLSKLGDALPGVLAESRPDLVVYLAGADPHEGDRLGRLRLTFDGLARRDAMVIGACREVGIPVTVTIAGGYGRDIAHTVEAHRRTAEVASQYA